MNKVSSHKKPLIISGDRAKEAIELGLDRYLQKIGHQSNFASKSGSINFTDEEFAAMLQALKEDK